MTLIAADELRKNDFLTDLADPDKYHYFRGYNSGKHIVITRLGP